MRAALEAQVQRNTLAADQRDVFQQQTDHPFAFAIRRSMDRATVAGKLLASERIAACCWSLTSLPILFALTITKLLLLQPASSAWRSNRPRANRLRADCRGLPADIGGVPARLHNGIAPLAVGAVGRLLPSRDCSSCCTASATSNVTGVTASTRICADCLVDVRTGNVLADRFGVLDALALANVVRTQLPSPAVIADRHPLATTPAQQQPLQQARALLAVDSCAGQRP